MRRVTERTTEGISTHNNNNWFVNKTNAHIPTNLQWLLSLDQKNSLPTTRQKFPLFKIIADGESCIKTINDKEQQEIKRMTLSTK